MIEWGKLLDWWSLASRCLAIAGVFASLERKRNVAGNTIQKRYNQAMKAASSLATSKGRKLYSFSHAFKFAQLGRFLMRFPRFLHQMTFTSLTDWRQKIDGGKMVMNVLEELVVEDSGVWKTALGTTAAA